MSPPFVWLAKNINPAMVASQLQVPTLPISSSIENASLLQLHSEHYSDVGIGYVKKIRPSFSAEQSPVKLLAAAACLSYACEFDCYIESLSYPDLGQLLTECQQSLNTPLTAGDVVLVEPGLIMTQLLILQLPRLLPTYYLNILSQFKLLLCGFQEEAVFQHQDQYDIDLYRQIRCKTISIQPFFAIIADDCGPLDTVSRRELTLLENEVVTMMGLQSDLVGLQKGLARMTFMSYAFMSAKTHQSNDLDSAVAAGIQEHNMTFERATTHHQRLMRRDEATRKFADQVFNFTALHLNVFMKSSRYESTGTGQQMPTSKPVLPLISAKPMMVAA